MPLRLTSTTALSGLTTAATATTGAKRYSNGKFVDLTYPGSVATFPWGINDKGTVVGSYLNSKDTKHGFIYSNGTWATLDDPTAKTGGLLGISNTGAIVGGFTPFLYEQGTFKLISVPNNPTAYINVRAHAGETH